MKTILDLPRDLVEEILYRIPSKSMKAVRLTCTKWNTLCRSENFMKMHIAKTTKAREGESQMVMKVDHTLHLMSLFVGDIDNPSTELKGKLTCLDEEEVKVSRVFYCEGLLLCVLEEDTRLVVWNPYLGQTRWIEPRYSYRAQFGRRDRYMYALGYVNHHKDKTCRSYKILRFLDRNIGIYKNECDFTWYEIYDFESDLWTTLDITPHWSISWNPGVSLNGNTFWCATNRHSGQSDSLDDHTICFDFTREGFGPLLRLPFEATYDEYVSLSCVRGEKLAVLLQHNEVLDELEIWITTKIEREKVLWSKFLILNLDRYVDGNPFSNSSGSIFIDEDKKLAMGFREGFIIVGEDGNFRKFDIGKFEDGKCRPPVCSYVPSLVQIKHVPGGKRKRTSNSEKRLFEQKMLELVECDKAIKKQKCEWERKEKTDD